MPATSKWFFLVKRLCIVAIPMTPATEMAEVIITTTSAFIQAFSANVKSGVRNMAAVVCCRVYLRSGTFTAREAVVELFLVAPLSK